MNARKTIANELHAPARRHFPTRAVEVKGINDLYQADLVEMIPYSKFNKGYKYLLTIINCFSKIAYAIPLKNKSGLEVSNALEPILKNNRMNHLQTDAGLEFYNTHVTRLMKKYGINHYSTYSDKKGSIVERFNRSLKEMMYRKFTEVGNYNWVNILNSLLKQYNYRRHRTIGMAPIEVNRRNEIMVRRNIDRNRQKYKTSDKKVQFKIGDKVRISKYKKVFDKGYLPNWTNEMFTVYTVQPTVPITYKLKDYKNHVIKGSFYGHELKKAKHGDIYLVEKVLKKKGDKAYVKWLGFDGTHNTWIDKNQLV